MKKLRPMAIGIATGVIAEIGSVFLSFSGVNLFHGGQPNVIVNALLPGIGIVGHLSSHAPSAVPGFLLIISLAQFPIYGALLGRDYANKSISRISVAAIALHLMGSTIAFYGVMLEKQWQTASAEWGVCHRANDNRQRLAAVSDQILRNRQWAEQTKGQIQKLRTEKERGIVYTPDPEAGLDRILASQRDTLDSLWETYKKAGGEAKSIEEVQAVSPPCGKAPSKPMFFD